MEAENLIEKIRAVASKRVLFLPHAIKQMSHPERMIGSDEVSEIIQTGEMIEEYPNDPRGPSALLLGMSSDERVIHVVVSPKEEYLAIITAYLPSLELWEPGFRKRRS